MKTRTLLSWSAPVTALLCAIAASGQDLPERFALIGDGTHPYSNLVMTSDSAAVDSSLLTVDYRADFSTSPGGARMTHRTRLYVGDERVLFDDITHRARSTGKAALGDAGTPSYYYISVLTDRAAGERKVTVPDIWAGLNGSPGGSAGLAHVYTERAPRQEWTVTDVYADIAGYRCQRAECDFRGRRWEAWFTTEIPFSEGPWKLRGLPGLILYARDTTGQYGFEAVSVTDKPVPVNDYVYEHEKRTTYRKFKRYERSCWQMPMSFTGGTALFIRDGKGARQAGEDWELPYYPMEW